mmetsp:Transcript_11345/g.16669  ORF Transcript_11345/g.16669 Transcript_11345/m.16669 type:complete len:167 (-) Transcript_11345:315-815(-)|eukprot:CAMPEP_0194211750 /NCGR_PEP_ID=MMETSP0156-20130528/11098_1 /TAXON_ID=33649 /ORGANISM="Thalassionema nitzschioides, Strain L26-B" /LENGTH=166 /DNA_ID=CAMNT_0038939403 /DNA_START=73 /DNA_END=573 /DNA_ORIENTATION=-
MSTTVGRKNLSFKQKMAEFTEIVSASAADVGTDWYYYLAQVKDYTGPADLSNYNTPLYVFTIIGSVLAVVVLLALCLNLCGKLSNAWFQRVLALEVLLSDIPQFVLTGLIENEKGGTLTLAGGINIATSAYNMFLDVIASCRLEEDDAEGEKDDEEEAGLVQAQAE